MSIKVGVIGVGYLGQHHARIYSELEDAELVAIVDTDVERGKEISMKYGCKSFTNYREVLDDVEAVSIATPTSFHFDVAMDCLSAGKDVLIEKPITTTVAEANTLIEIAERKDALLQVGHLERYNPAVVAVSSMIKKPEFIESERVAPFHTRGTDVDVTLDLMIHDIDIVMSLLGGAHVKDVRVVGARVMTEKVDVAKAWIEFDGGVTALITASRISGEKQRKLKIYQEDSFVMLDYIKMDIRKYYRSDDGIASESLHVEQKEPLKEELVDFIDCVSTRRKPRVSGTDGRDALEVALNITAKIRNAGGKQ